MARIEQRPEKRLQESDFLLGVYDEYRMGAMRFKEDVNGNFYMIIKQWQHLYGQTSTEIISTNN